MFEILNMHNQSGFMYLWWTPFYGTGVVILILIFNYLKQHIKNKKLLNILLFITIFLSLTILEYLGGTILNYIVAARNFLKDDMDYLKYCFAHYNLSCKNKKRVKL